MYDGDGVSLIKRCCFVESAYDLFRAKSDPSGFGNHISVICDIVIRRT